MSRHLDRQTGPNITIGNQRSQFYRCEKEFRMTEGCRSPFNSQSDFFLPYPHQSLLPNLGSPWSCRFVLLLKPNLAWSRSSSGSLPCHKGLSLPLCLHLASFPRNFIFLVHSPKVCHYWPPHSMLKRFTWQTLFLKKTNNKCKPHRSRS